MSGVSDISMLARREIEARITGPLIRAFVEEIGEERAIGVVTRVISLLAKESGVQLAKKLGGNTLKHFAKGLATWSAGGVLDIEILELSETKYSFNVNRCGYADMYKKLGMADLGVFLSCGRDFELVKGFNPRMKLIRTKTIMEGNTYCDFRITLE